MKSLARLFFTFLTVLFCTTMSWAALNEIVNMADLLGDNPTLGTGVTDLSEAYVAGNTVYNFTGEGSIHGLTYDALGTVISEKTANIVVAAWVKPTAAADMAIFSTGAQANGFMFNLTSGGLKLTTKNVKDNASTYTIPRDGQTWTLVAVSFPLGGGNGRLYVSPTNNQYMSHNSGMGAINTANPLSFGIGTGNSDGDRDLFQGTIANLKVFTSDSAQFNNQDVATLMGDAPEYKTASTEDTALTVTEINTLLLAGGQLTVPANTEITFDVALAGGVLSLVSTGSVTLVNATADKIANIDFSMVDGAVKRASVTTTSIGVNFNSANATDVSSALVADGAWTQTTGGSSSTTIADDLSTVTWSCNNLYTETSNGNTYSSGSYSFLQGYLDDGGNGIAIKVTNIPYATYDLYIYCETDTENTTFSRKTVNGVDYTCDTTGVATVNDTAGGSVGQWGASGSRGTTTPVLGTNTMCVQGLTGGELTIASAKYTGRGCISAIQIVDMSTVVRTDLGYDRTAGTVANGTIFSAHLSTAEVRAGQFEFAVSNATAPTGLTWHLYYNGVELEGTPSYTLVDGKLVVTSFTQPTLPTFENVTFGDDTVMAAVVAPTADFYNADVNPIIQADGSTPYYAAKVTNGGPDTRVFGGSSVKTALDASLNLLVTDGDFSYVHGGSNSDAWQNSSSHNVTGDIYVEMAGGSTDWLFGGNYKDGYGVTFGGNIDVVVSGDAVVNKTIAGGSFGAHRNSTTYGSATDPVDVGVTVKNVQSRTTENGEGAMPTGYIVGGGIFMTNGSSQTLNGNSSVKIELADNATGTFVKNIVGGHYVSGNDTASHQVTGNTTITVKAPETVTFSGNLYAGGYGGNSSVAGTSTINLYGGTYTGKISKGQVASDTSYTLNIYGDVNVAEVEDAFAYTVASDASLTLGKADLSHVTSAMTIIKGDDGIIKLGTNRNITFAGFAGGEIELTTNDGAVAAELAVAAGVTDCSLTIFKVDGFVKTGTISDGKLTFSDFDVSDYTAPYSATVTADANWTDLAWTDANGKSVPMQIWGVEDETPAVNLTVADSVTGDVTISLPIAMTLGEVTVTAGDKTLVLEGTNNNQTIATSLEVVSGTVAYASDVVLPTTCAIAEGARVNYTVSAEMAYPTVTGDGTFAKYGSATLKVDTENFVMPKTEVVEGELRINASNNTALNVTVGETAQMSVWGAGRSLTNEANLFTLKSGSTIEFANGSSGITLVEGQIVLDAEGGSATMLGTVYGGLNLSTDISGKGELVLAAGGCGGYLNAYTISGVISGDISIKQEDDNSGDNVTLSGVNTYTGTTTVNSNLKMTGAAVLPGAVTIAAEKTLTLNGTTLNGGISGSGTLAVAGGTVTLGGYVLNGDNEKAVVPQEMPVTVAAGAILDIATENGISWTSVTGEGTLKISSSNYTFGIGGADNGNTLTTSLEVPSGTELWFRVWRDYTVSVPDLTVNGTIKVDNRVSSGGGTLTLEVASEKTLSGTGTIDYGITFADGANLDLTEGAPLTVGSVSYATDATLNVYLPEMEIVAGDANGHKILAGTSLSAPATAKVYVLDSDIPTLDVDLIVKSLTEGLYVVRPVIALVERTLTSAVEEVWEASADENKWKIGDDATDTPGEDDDVEVHCSVEGAALTATISTEETPLSVGRLTATDQTLTLGVIVSDLKYATMPPEGVEVTLVSIPKGMENVEVQVRGLRYGASAVVTQTETGATAVITLPASFYPDGATTPILPGVPFRAEVQGEVTWDALEWTQDGVATTEVPTNTDLVELVLTGDAVLKSSETVLPAALFVAVSGQGHTLNLPDAAEMTSIGSWHFDTDTIYLLQNEAETLPENTSAFPGRVRYTYNYITEEGYTTTTNYVTEFAGGYVGPSPILVGGTVDFSGGIVQCPSVDATGTASTLVFSGTVQATIDAELVLGTVDFQMKGFAKVQADRLMTADGEAGRVTTMDLSGSSTLEVTGRVNADNNTASLLFSHWAGETTVTLRDEARLIAEHVGAALAHSGRSSFTLEDQATMKVAGLRIHNFDSDGSNVEMHLNGGQLLIGKIGLNSTASTRKIDFSFRGGALGVWQDVTLGTEALALVDGCSGSPTFTTAEDAVLTLNDLGSFGEATFITFAGGTTRLEFASEDPYPMMAVQSGATVETNGTFSVNYITMEGGTLLLERGTLTTGGYETTADSVLQVPVMGGGVLAMAENANVPDLSATAVRLWLEPNQTTVSSVVPELPLVLGGLNGATEGTAATLKSLSVLNNSNGALTSYVATLKTGLLGAGIYVNLEGNVVLRQKTIEVTGDYELLQSSIDAEPFQTFIGSGTAATLVIPEGGVALPQAVYSGDALAIRAQGTPTVLIQGTQATLSTDVTFDLSAWDIALQGAARGAIRDVPVSFCLMSGNITVKDGVTLSVDGVTLPAGVTGEIVTTADGIYYVMTANRRARTLSVNFTNRATPLVAPPSMLGVYALPLAAWNDLAESFTAPSMNMSDLGGVASTLATVQKDGETLYTQLTAYNNRVVTDDDAPTAMLKVWLDDVQAQTVKVSNLPFAAYRVALIFSTDMTGVAYAPITVNGAQYTMDAAGYTRRDITGYRSETASAVSMVDVAADTAWGSSVRTEAMIQLGNNALVTDVLTDANAEILLPASIYGQVYAGLAALQILEAPEVVTETAKVVTATVIDPTKTSFNFEDLTLTDEAGNLTTWVNGSAHTLKLVFSDLFLDAADPDITVIFPATFEAGTLMINKRSDFLTLRVANDGGLAVDAIDASACANLRMTFPMHNVGYTAAKGISYFDQLFNNNGQEYTIVEGATLVLGENSGIVTNLDFNGTASLNINVPNSDGTLRRNYPVTQTETIEESKTTDMTFAGRSITNTVETDNSGMNLLVEAGDTYRFTNKWHVDVRDPVTVDPAWTYTQTGGQAYFEREEGLLIFNNISTDGLHATVNISGDGRLETNGLYAWDTNCRVTGSVSEHAVLAVRNIIGVQNGQSMTLDFTGNGTLEALDDEMSVVGADKLHLNFNGGRLASSGSSVIKAPVTINSAEAAPTIVAVSSSSILTLDAANRGAGYLSVPQGTLAVAHANALGNATDALTVMIAENAGFESRIESSFGKLILNKGAILNVVRTETITLPYTTQIANAIEFATGATADNIIYRLNGMSYTASIDVTTGEITFSEAKDLTAVTWKADVPSGDWRQDDGTAWSDVYHNGAAVTFGDNNVTTTPVAVNVVGAIAPASMTFSSVNGSTYAFSSTSDGYLTVPGTEIDLGTDNRFDVPIKTAAANTKLLGTAPTVRLFGVLSADRKTASLVGDGNLNANAANHGIWLAAAEGGVAFRTFAPKVGEVQELSPFGEHMMGVGASAVTITGGGTVRFKGHTPGTNWNGRFTGQIFVENGSTLDFAATREDGGSNNPYFRQGDPNVVWTTTTPFLTLSNGATVNFGPQFRAAVSGYDQRTNTAFLSERPFVIGKDSNIRFGFTNNNRQILTHGLTFNGDNAKITIGATGRSGSSSSWYGLYLTRGTTFKVAGVGEDGDVTDPKTDTADPTSATYGKLTAGITARIVSETTTDGLARFDDDQTRAALADQGITFDVGEQSTLSIEANFTMPSEASDTVEVIKVGDGRLMIDHPTIEAALPIVVEKGILGGSSFLADTDSSILMKTGTTIEAGLSLNGTLTFESGTTLAIDPNGQRLLYAERTLFTNGGTYTIMPMTDTIPSSANRMPTKVVSWGNVNGTSASVFVLSKDLRDAGYGLVLRDDGIYLMEEVMWVRQLTVVNASADLPTSLAYNWYADNVWRRGLTSTTYSNYDVAEGEAPVALFLLPDAYVGSTAALTVTLRLDRPTTFSAVRFATYAEETAIEYVDGVATEVTKRVLRPRTVNVLYVYDLTNTTMPGEDQAFSFTWVPTLMVDRADTTQTPVTSWADEKVTATLQANVPAGYESIRRDTTITVYRSASAAAININFTGKGQSDASWIQSDASPCGVYPFAGVYWNNASPVASGTSVRTESANHTVYSFVANVAGLMDENNQGETVDVTYMASNFSTVSDRRGEGNIVLSASYMEGRDSTPVADIAAYFDTVPAPVQRGWHIKIDQVPFTDYDLYLLFAGAEADLATYPAVRIKIGENDWRTFTVKNNWVAPADANDMWDGVGALVSGGYVTGRNMLHLRFSASLNASLQITSADHILGADASENGLAALQIVACDRAAYTRTLSGNWSDGSGWNVTNKNGVAWQNATVEIPHAAILSDVGSLKVDTLASMPWLEVVGGSDLTLSGTDEALDLGALDLSALDEDTHVNIQQNLFAESPNVLFASGIFLSLPETEATTTNDWRWIYPTTAAQNSTVVKHSTNDLVIQHPMFNILQVDAGTLWLNADAGVTYTRNNAVMTDGGDGILGKTGSGTITMPWNALRTENDTLAIAKQGVLRLETQQGSLPSARALIAEGEGEILLYCGEQSRRPFPNGRLIARNGGTIAFERGTNMFENTTRPSIILQGGRFRNDHEGAGHNHAHDVTSTGLSAIYMNNEDRNAAWSNEALNLWSGTMTIRDGALALWPNVENDRNFLYLHGIARTLPNGTEVKGGAINVQDGATFYSNYSICGRMDSPSESTLLKLGQGTWVQTRSISNRQSANGGNATDNYNTATEIVEGTLRWNLGSAVYNPQPKDGTDACLLTIDRDARMDGTGRLQNTRVKVQSGATLASGLPTDWTGIDKNHKWYGQLPAKFKGEATDSIGHLAIDVAVVFENDAILELSLDRTRDRKLTVGLPAEGETPATGSVSFGSTLTLRLTDLPASVTDPIPLTNFHGTVINSASVIITCPEAAALDAKVQFGNNGADLNNLYLVPSGTSYIWQDKTTGNWSDATWTYGDNTTASFVEAEATVARVVGATADTILTVNKKDADTSASTWTMGTMVLSTDAGRAVTLKQGNTVPDDPLPTEYLLNRPLLHDVLWKLGTGTATVETPIVLHNNQTMVNVKEGTLILKHPMLTGQRDTVSINDLAKVGMELTVDEGATLQYALTTTPGLTATTQANKALGVYSPVKQTLTGKRSGAGTIVVDAAGSELILSGTSGESGLVAADHDLNYHVKQGTLTLEGNSSAVPRTKMRTITLEQGTTLNLATESALGWASNIHWVLANNATILPKNQARVRGTFDFSESGTVTLGTNGEIGALDGDVILWVPANSTLTMAGSWETPEGTTSGLIEKNGPGTWVIEGAFNSNLPVTLNKGETVIAGNGNAIAVSNLETTLNSDWTVASGATLRFNSGVRPKQDFGNAGSLTVASGATLHVANAAITVAAGDVALSDTSDIIFEDGATLLMGDGAGIGSLTIESRTELKGTVFVVLNLTEAGLNALDPATTYTVVEFLNNTRLENAGTFQLAGTNLIALSNAGWTLRDRGNKIVLEAFGSGEAYTWTNVTDNDWSAEAAWLAPLATTGTSWAEILASGVDKPSVIFADKGLETIPEASRTVNWTGGEQHLTALQANNSVGNDYTLQSRSGTSDLNRLLVLEGDLLKTGEGTLTIARPLEMDDIEGSLKVLGGQLILAKAFDAGVTKKLPLTLAGGGTLTFASSESSELRGFITGDQTATLEQAGSATLTIASALDEVKSLKISKGALRLSMADLLTLDPTVSMTGGTLLYGSTLAKGGSVAMKVNVGEAPAGTFTWSAVAPTSASAAAVLTVPSGVTTPAYNVATFSYMPKQGHLVLNPNANLFPATTALQMNATAEENEALWLGAGDATANTSITFASLSGDNGVIGVEPTINVAAGIWSKARTLTLALDRSCTYGGAFAGATTANGTITMGVNVTKSAASTEAQPVFTYEGSSVSPYLGPMTIDADARVELNGTWNGDIQVTAEGSLGGRGTFGSDTSTVSVAAEGSIGASAIGTRTTGPNTTETVEVPTQVTIPGTLALEEGAVLRVLTYRPEGEAATVSCITTKNLSLPETATGELKLKIVLDVDTSANAIAVSNETILRWSGMSGANRLTADIVDLNGNDLNGLYYVTQRMDATTGEISLVLVRKGGRFWFIVR